MLYQREEYGRIPALIEAVRDRRAETLTFVLEAHVSRWHAPTFSLFALAAVSCRDSSSHVPAKGATAGFQWLELRGVCPHWSDGASPPGPPLRTRVPTLILSGETDPITPPRYAHDVARALGSAARWVRFPATTHGVAAQSECARTLMGAFLDNPSSELDVTCAARAVPIEF